MKRGFTLIEAIIVISIITLLAGLSSLSLVSFGKGSQQESGQTVVVQVLREAQSNSLANIDDKPWGVRFETERIIIWEDSGSGYNSTDSSNRYKLLPEGVQLSTATSEVLFDKGKGTPSQNIQVTLTSESLPPAIISMNLEGMIEY